MRTRSIAPLAASCVTIDLDTPPRYCSVAPLDGLRRGELAGLKWSDIDFERRTATIRGAIGQTPGKTWYKSTKTDSVAAVALSDFALEALRAQRLQQAKDKLAVGAMYDDQGFVFATELGGLPSPARSVTRCAASLDAPASPFAAFMRCGTRPDPGSSARASTSARSQRSSVTPRLRRRSTCTRTKWRARKPQPFEICSERTATEWQPRRIRATKRPANTGFFPRREWDSNPRTAQHRLRFSRPLH